MAKTKAPIEGPVRFGDLVRDKITGFEGVVTDYTDFFYGCRRIGVQPRELKKDGDGIAKSVGFDEPQLDILDRGIFEAKPLIISDPVDMGDEVEDQITKFQGIVIAIAHFAFGQRRIAVQPQHIKKGGDGIAEDQWFDEPGLKVKKKSKITRQVP
jgi:heat shock protein HspQ